MVINMNIGKYYNLNKDIFINKIETNSKLVSKGSLFVCISGIKDDGNKYIDEAIRNGAIFIISDKFSDIKIDHVIVKDSNLELGKILKIFYDYPLRDINLIGVTGTDGKTTTSLIIYFMFNYFKINSGYIGTNGIYYEDRKINIKNTTPELNTLYKHFHNYNVLDYKFISMEVSSHSISMNRISGLRFDYAIFTNISHEHLDYHKNINSYYHTKKKLFNRSRINIVNVDDKFGFILSRSLNCITFGKSNLADFYLFDIDCQKDRSYFSFKYLNYEVYNIEVNLINEYNIYNIIPSIIIGLNSGLSLYSILMFLKQIPKIPGRLEHIKYLDNDIYVDFAHTPNALLNVLKNLRNYKYNNIFIILGAAGNKDKSKRSKMGVIASNYSDYVIFTNEDPNGEDENDIINDLLSNVNKNNYEIILNRKEAIIKGISYLKNNDCLIITGKGLESTMNFGDKIIIHSDYDIVLETVKVTK